MPRISAERQRLRHVALRLQAVVRQRTRLVHQLHQLLARTFPELALLVQDISTGWVLELLTRYPTAKVLAQASADDLQNIPYLPHARVADLLAAARHSIASRDGELAAELIRALYARRGLSLREAVLDRVHTFDLELCPGTEKRNG
jgi:hypothetical protein